MDTPAETQAPGVIRLLCLPARLDGGQAARLFRRPRFANLFGLLAPAIRVAVPDNVESRRPPFVERLWLPAYAARFRTVSRKGVKGVWTSIDAWGGQFALFDCIDDLEERELKEEYFSPGIDEAKAVDIGRRGLMRYILAQRGQIDKPVVEALDEIRRYLYPVWVLYRRRYRRHLDIIVLDARTGKPAGAKAKVAILNALVAKNKCKENSL